MINNKNIMLFLLLPFFGYGHENDINQDFPREKSDKVSDLLDTLQSKVGNNHVLLIVEPEKVVDRVDAAQEHAENVGLGIPEKNIEKQNLEQPKEKNLVINKNRMY